jgi:Pregnancy-associated plasma protein-A/PKD domain
MKNLYIFLLLIVGVVGFGQSQVVNQTCATDQLIQNLIKTNPDLKNRLDIMDKEIYDASKTVNKTSLPILTIPVVFFVIHDNQPLGVGSNISDLQVDSQLSAMNSYFSSYGLKFCLATKVGPTLINGINHINNSTLTDHDINTEQSALVNTANLFSGNNYLRIWVVKSINGPTSGILGYSMFPNSSTIFDGIVMKYDALGDVSVYPNGVYIPSYDKGKALVHEVGHYLALYHTFEQSCAGMNSSTCYVEGDRICDTPPVNAPNFTCTNGINTCSEVPDLPDSIHNFMDYGDDLCATEFTIGQKERMFNVLNIYRNELISSDNLIYTGTCGSSSLITASFKADKYQNCSNSLVSFTPISTGVGLTYLWDFGDVASGINNISSLPNPTHTYSTSNNLPYIVTLTINNSTETFTSSVSIFVSTCTPLLNSETAWRFGNNLNGNGNSIDFSSGVPVMSSTVNVNDLVFGESDACVSNLSGQLLFKSNGNTVANDNFVLTNGFDASNFSAHRGSLIIKDPNLLFPNRYYLFIKNAKETQTRYGFRYSLVDSIDPINSSINPINFNIPVIVPSSYGYLLTNNGGIEGGEGVTAIAAQDGYWIITTGKKTSGYYFMVFKLNSNGLNFVSETQTTIAAELPQYSPNSSGLHSIEVSPNGDKILLTGNSQLYDFNKFSGQVIQNSKIELNTASYGASFSPNNNLLYLNSGKNYQINLQDLNQNTSRKIFYIQRSISYGDIQRGPDNKLYYIYPYESPKSLYVIHNPNGLITENNPNACLFSKNGPSINRTLTNNAIGLPNMINSKKETAFETNSISSYPVSCNTRSFFPDSYGSSFNWNFGDPASGVNNNYTGTLINHTFSNSGTYIVTLSNSANVFIAQTTIIIGITPKVIIGNTSACISGVNNNSNITSNSVILENGESAVWSITGGAGTISGVNNQSNVTVNWSTLPGIITLTVTSLSGCIFTTSKVISANTVVTPTFTPIARICAGATLPVLATTSTNGIGITGTWSPAVNNTTTTTYTFTPTTGQCATTATLTITVLPTSDPLCGNTNSSCALSTLTLNVPEPNATVIYRRQNSISTITNYLVTTGKNVTMRAGDLLV